SATLLFRRASVGNPDEPITEPPIETFGGDNLDSKRCGKILSPTEGRLFRTSIGAVDRSRRLEFSWPISVGPTTSKLRCWIQPPVRYRFLAPPRKRQSAS